MHDFRAFVEADEIATMENTDHSFAESIINSSKEKTDIEMGSREQDGLTLPEILLRIECNAAVEKRKHEVGDGVERTTGGSEPEPEWKLEPEPEP